MLNNPFYTSAMNADLWISKVSEGGYDSRFIQCQANGQTKSPRPVCSLPSADS